MTFSTSTQRIFCIAIVGVLCAGLLSPSPVLAQTTTDPNALPSPEENVSGGALRARAPGNWVEAGIARYQENTSGVVPTPIEEEEDFNFKRELLVSTLETFFDTINTFLGLGALLGGTGSLGDINFGDVNFDDLLGTLAANTVESAVDTTVEAGRTIAINKLQNNLSNPVAGIILPTALGLDGSTSDIF